MRPFLIVWVGADIAAKAAPVGEVVLIGAWMNGLARIPFAHLQSQSRPDLVAKFHLIELVPFVSILWVGLRVFGLVGGAAAWTLRVTFDAILLLWAAGFRVEVLKSFLIAVLLIGTSCLLAFLAPFPSVLGLVLGATLVVAAAIWAAIFEPQLRKYIYSILSSMAHRLFAK